MALEAPVIRAVFYTSLAEFLSTRGIDLWKLIQATGPAPSEVKDPAGEVSVAPLIAALERASELVGDPCLGLTWANGLPGGGSGVYGYLMMNARTLEEALTHSARYAHLVIRPITATFSIQQEGRRRYGEISWCWPASLPEPSFQFRLFMHSAFVGKLRLATVQSWTPVSVELEIREPVCREQVAKIFGPATIFNGTGNIMRIAEADLALELPKADTRLLSVMMSHAEQIPAERTSDDVNQQVRALILDRLGKQDVSLRAIAQILDMPERTLQARLSQKSGTTFEIILNEARQQLAKRYLADTDLPLTDIALLLGFSEHAAFARAARRWLGMAPSAYRKQNMRLPRGS